MTLPSVTVTTKDTTFFLNQTEEGATPFVGGFWTDSGLVKTLGYTAAGLREVQDGVMTVPSVANWLDRLEKVGGYTAGPTGAWAYDWWCVYNFLKYGGTCLVGGTGSEVYTTATSSSTPLHQKKYDLNVTFASTGSNSMAAAYDIANSRQDCLAVIGTTYSNQINTTWTDPWGSLRGDYSVNVYGHKRMFDETDAANQKVFSITVAPDVAGCFARAYRDFNSWTTPAGIRRGRILGVINMVHSVSTTDTFAGTIDTAKGNIVTTLPGKGTFLMGNNTGNAASTSALAKINAMLVVIYLRKKMTELANDLLYEINNSQTRSLFVSAADPILRDLQASGGLYEYRLVCDESNNTAAVLDANKFVADIYVKISKTAETIIISIIPVNSTVNLG